MPAASAASRSASAASTSPPYSRAGSRMARSRSVTVIGGSRYWWPLTASASPGKRAQAPRYSERIVTATYKPGGGDSAIATSASVSCRASPGPCRRACSNSSSNWSIRMHKWSCGPPSSSAARAVGARRPWLSARRNASTRSASSARPSSAASARARWRSGPPRGITATVRQREPQRACSWRSRGSTPARINELLPEPESPCTTTSCCVTSLDTTASTMRSRPKKTGHSDSSNARSPG